MVQRRLGRPPALSQEARRAQVIALAEELFARHGYHHVTMDDIAERAGTTKPALYRLFGTKLELYQTVIDTRGQALVSAIETTLAQVTEQTTGRAIVRAVVAAYIRFVEDSGETFSILFESDVTRDDGIRRRIEQASAAAAEAICRGLRELAGLPPAQADLLSAGLVGLATTVATRRHRTDEVPVAETVDLITQLAWRGVAGLVDPHPV